MGNKLQRDRERGLRPTAKDLLLLAGHSSLAAAFAQLSTGVWLGRAVPPRVALGTYVAESLLTLGFMTLLLLGVDETLRHLSWRTGKPEIALGHRPTLLLLAALAPAAVAGTSWLFELSTLSKSTIAASLYLTVLLVLIVWPVWRSSQRQARKLALANHLVSPGKDNEQESPRSWLPSFLAARLAVIALGQMLVLGLLQPRLGPGRGLLVSIAGLLVFGIASRLWSHVCLRWQDRSNEALPLGKRGFGSLLQTLAVHAGVLIGVSLLQADPFEISPARVNRHSPAPNLPNVLLISLDTLRADRLGCYGYTKNPTSPTIDRLARQGLVFENMASTAPWTLPAHASLFTGLLPVDLPQYQITETPSWAEWMQENGYYTTAFTAGAFLNQQRFGKGFDEFYDTLEDGYHFGFSPPWLRLALRLRRRAGDEGVGLFMLNPLNHWRSDKSGRTSAWAGPLPIAHQTARWIDRYSAQTEVDPTKQRPFFLFFHTFGIHEYYLADRPARLWAEDFQPNYRGYLLNNNLRYREPMPKEHEDLEFEMALYDGALRETDIALATILAAIDQAGLTEETLVILTSDHGEGFRPDINRSWHGARLHDDLIRIPLILRWPGHIEAGTREHQQASLVDVLPTALELLDLPPIPNIRGHALLAKQTDKNSLGVAYSAVAEATSGSPRLSARSVSHKYISGGEEDDEFYDLVADPTEEQNLAASNHPHAEELSAALDALRTEANAPDSVDAETLETLRSLGYID